ncbi:MAG TPA: hypothetical protein VJO52_01560 [Gemmatimonadaceae bacterium]|nr:hypothetical protein [Gemmatimonadaceae bacterium]
MWVKGDDRTPEERTRLSITADRIAESPKQIHAARGRLLAPRTDIGPNTGAFAAFGRRHPDCYGAMFFSSAARRVPAA